MKGDIDGAEMILSEGRVVEATSEEEAFKGAWFSVTILKLPPEQNNTKGKALIEYKNILEDDNETPLTEHVPLSNIRPLPPQPKAPDDQCFRVKDVVNAFFLGGWWTGSVSPLPPQPRAPGNQCFQVKDVVDAFFLGGWWPGSVSEVFDNPKRYIVTLANNNEDVEFCTSDLRPHWEWVDGKWVKSPNLQEVLVSVDCEEQMELSCNTTTTGAGTNVQLERSVAPNCSSKKHGPRENEMGLSAACKEPAKRKHVEGTITEGDATPLHRCKKSKDGSSANPLVSESKMKETNLQKEHDVSSYKKEDCANTGINRIEKPNVVLEIQQSKSVPRISQSTSAGKDDAAGALEEMCSEEQTATEVESSAISRLEQAGSEEMCSEEQTATDFMGSQTMSTDKTSVFSATDCQRKIIKMAGESGRFLHENEEESPLTCYKELKPGVTKIHSVVMEENHLDDDEPREGQYLPFVKSLPMWKAVESMEMFQVMPQNPHFGPLIKWKEIIREGLAIGHMLSFASMVQRTSKLTVADPRNHFTCILDALPDFEILGFDVKAIRGRTSDLLLMKDRHEHLQGHSKQVKLQVEHYSDELNKLNEEIDAKYKKMRELEETLALLSSVKESKTSQLTTLQVSSDVTTQDIQRVEYDFESLAGSPW